MTFEIGENTSYRAPSKSLAAYRSASMIVVAIAFSIALYIVVGYAFIGSSIRNGASTMLRNQMYAGALFLALGSILLRRLQLGPARLEAVAAARGPEAVARHILNWTIICAVIGEAIGVLGLVLTVIIGEPDHVLRLGAVALLVVLINYPRRSAWDRTITHFASKSNGTST